MRELPPRLSRVWLSTAQNDDFNGETVKALADVYDYGVVGITSIDKVKPLVRNAGMLTNEQIQLMLNRGVADVRARTEARQAAMNGLRAGVRVNRKTGTRMSDDAITKAYMENYEKRTGETKERQKYSMRVSHNFAKALGVRVVFYASQLGADGKRYYINQNGVRAEAPNGYYTSDGTVYIDINSGNSGQGAILYTMSHELTHFIKDWSPAKYQVFESIIFNKYAEKVSAWRRLLIISLKLQRKTGAKSHVKLRVRK